MTHSSPMQIGSVVIEPGEQCTVQLPLARLYTNTQLKMPVHVIHGREAGPRLFVCAAVHGDELNGIPIVHRLLERTWPDNLRGSLLLVPVVNVYGLITHSRYLPDRR
ncbi:MAG: succinylglutamate desuccinylase/aspartoacylase family protein, partial [Anaerolineales bacterium]|nr:succinylglutamate desuccinylase/aspartoacylase family protein [Anaerolineales bacterium]